MRIGILSDTHNHKTRLTAALEHLRQEGIDTLIHCGDMTTTDTAELLSGFCVYYAAGNGDVLWGEITGLLQRGNPSSRGGLILPIDLDGQACVVVHGHQPGKVSELATGGKYRYIFHGHSHTRRDEWINGTRVINPGALGGLNIASRSFAILDLTSGKLEFVALEGPTL